MNSIFQRTSVRDFINKEVEKEKIEYVLRAAMAAPSAGNQQPWEFYVISNKGLMQSLANSSPYAKCLTNAPMAFVVCFKTSIKFPEYAQIDVAAATQNMLLAIDNVGLGGVWLGIAPIKERMETVEKLLELPEGVKAFAIVPCGYPVKVMQQQDRFDSKKVHEVE